MERMINTLGGGADATAPGRFQAQACLVCPSLFSVRWGDYYAEREQAQKMHYVHMPQEQWATGVVGHLEAHPRNWAVRRWIEKTEASRREYAAMQASPRTVAEVPDADERMFRLWTEMAEEPWKYGDDIVEWLDLNESVQAGPKRWRAGAFWIRQEESEAEREAAIYAEEQRQVESRAATRIQAIVRGYQTRCRQEWRDCSTCLTHGICVDQIGADYVCSECFDDVCGSEDEDA